MTRKDNVSGRYFFGVYYVAVEASWKKLIVTTEMDERQYKNLGLERQESVRDFDELMEPFAQVDSCQGRLYTFM